MFTQEVVDWKKRRNWSLNCYYYSKCTKEAPNHQQESEQRIDGSHWRGDSTRA